MNYEKPLVFKIPLPSKYDRYPLKRINGFIKSILKYNKSSFYFKREIRINFYIIYMLFSIYYTSYK